MRAWINNYTSSFLWHVYIMTLSCPNFNNSGLNEPTFKFVHGWVIASRSCIDVITYPCSNLHAVSANLINTLRPRQNGRHFPDDIFKCIFLNENVWISIKISLNFVPRGPINNIPALVQIMAWRRPGDKPFSEPMMVSLLMHICVTLPQWVK